MLSVEVKINGVLLHYIQIINTECRISDNKYEYAYQVFSPEQKTLTFGTIKNHKRSDGALKLIQKAIGNSEKEINKKCKK